jgi:hypothetical protein
MNLLPSQELLEGIDEENRPWLSGARKHQNEVNESHRVALIHFGYLQTNIASNGQSKDCYRLCKSGELISGNSLLLRER